MSTIATTTNTTPFQFQYSLLDRSGPTGNLYAMVKSSTANTYDLYVSANDGTSWSLALSVTRANIVEIGPIFVLDPRYNQLAWVYRTNESSEDRVYLRTISDLSSPAWNAEVLVYGVNNGGVAGSVVTGMDVKVFVVPNWNIFTLVAFGISYGGNHGCSLFALTGLTMASMVVNNNLMSGTRQWMLPGTGRSTPALEVEHNGDGKTAAGNTPNLWLAFGRSYLGMVKVSWNGNGWTGPTSPVVVNPSIGADDTVTGRWDGNRFVMAVPNPASTSTVVVYERNKANTTTTTRTTPTHPTGVVRNCTVSYDKVTGDLRVYAVGTSSTVLYYVDFVRATSSWGSWASVLATAVLGGNGDNYGVRRGNWGNSKYDVYTAHSGAPNTLTHTQQLAAYPPSTPTWTAPGSGIAQDVAAGLTLDWVFTDPDPNDTQLSYALSRQVGAGAVQYYTAAGGTWGGSEVFNTSGTSAVTLASGWGADIDANHTYKVRVRDSTSLSSGYSAGLVVVPSAKVNPSITAPTAAQVITVDHVTVTWTASQQTAYRIVLKTNPGGVAVYDSGWVTSTATSVVVPYVLADLTGWTVELTTANNEGLASTTQTRNFTVDYVNPMTPTLVVTPNPANGYITVAITNPAPSGGAPTVTYQDLYRRSAGTTTAARLATGLASGATYNDWQAAGSQPYEYQVFVVGSNGASTTSAWTS